MKQTVINYWNQLQQRERWILGAGVVFVTALLLYQFIWAPWHKAINFMQEALVGHRSNVAWMQKTTEMMSDSGGVAQARRVRGQDQSLMSVIEQTARSTGVRDSIQQITPRENNTQVSVVLENTSFNKWVRWADILQSQYGVKVLQLSAEREEKPDTAEIRVIFARKS